MKSVLTKKQPEKLLLRSMKKTGGRGVTGRITSWHKGGGARKLWRVVDFAQEHVGVAGQVIAIEYDPNRNAFLALVSYENGKKGYLIAAQDVHVGSTLVCADKADIKPGNRMRLQHIPVGSMVYNVELEPERGGKIVRGAGGAARVLAQEGTFTHVQLPSSEVRKFPNQCFASVGMVSNPEYMYKRVRNAGASRLKGRRPTVRGTAMNPVDHPHGGGEGRTSRGMKFPKTPWGKPALGVKTRRKRWTDKLIMQRRTKKKKK